VYKRVSRFGHIQAVFVHSGRKRLLLARADLVYDLYRCPDKAFILTTFQLFDFFLNDRNEIGGLYDPKSFYTSLRKICKATPGLEPIKFHALRHTFATRGLENEMSGKAMQELLGHETEAMTLHYQQLLEKQARKEIGKLKDAF